MIKRNITKKLKQLTQEYGVVSVTGPRQSGKTTLVKSVFPDYEYINLENIAELERIKQDPLDFIKSVENGIIIDEVQRFPEILSYIQVSVDEKYQEGKFVITGSQNLLLSDKVSQSLAGRVGILTLLPLSIDELSQDNLLPKNYLELILKGFYPGLYRHKRTTNIFYNNYLNTYIERDVRSIRNIGDLSNFTRFLQILAGRVGQLLNLSEIGSAVGVNYKTIESWISILEASYVILRLEPYYKNFGKRIIKSPKIYFVDTGLVCSLLRIDNTKELKNHYLVGGLFENLIFIDLYKKKLNNLSTSNLYFFRDKHNNEVDLLMDTGVDLVPIEIKSSSTFSKDQLKGIKYFQNLLSPENTKGFLIYRGDTKKVTENIDLINYEKMEKIDI